MRYSVGCDERFEKKKICPGRSPDLNVGANHIGLRTTTIITLIIKNIGELEVAVVEKLSEPRPL